MTVARFTQPNFTTAPDATQYKSDIDASVAVLAEIAANFAAHEAAVPDMTVTLDAGKLFAGVYIVKAAQISAAFVAPAVDPRIDRIAIDTDTGDLVVIAGTEAVAPVAPAYSINHYPVCQVGLVVAQSSILNTDITDERPLVWDASKTEPEAEIVTTSGTSHNQTGIPAWATKIYIMLNAVAHSGFNGFYKIQIGDAGGLETTGYTSAAGTSNLTSGYLIRSAISVGDSHSGLVILTKQKDSSNTWVLFGGIVHSFAGSEQYLGCAGIKSLSGPLTQFSLILELGTAFNAGSFSSMWE